MRINIYLCVIFVLTLSMSVRAVTRERLDYLVSEMKSDDETRCSKSAIELAEYGPEAKEAIPALIEMIRSDEQNFYVGSVLPFLCSGISVDEILHLTNDNNSIVQSLAMECLKRHEIDKEKFLLIYSALLDHENPFVVWEAIDALCQIDAGKLCLDAALRLAKHEEPLIRALAVSSIEEIGIANTQVKQVLRDSFSSPDKREAVKAALIYQNLYPEEKAGLELIRELMKDEDRNVRWHAVRAVGNLKNADSQTLQLSRELLHDKDTVVILNACYAMIRHDIETEQAWGVLNKSLESNELTDLLPPLMVLKELGSAAGKYQEQLIKRVNDKDDVVQLIAISVLGEIQPSKERALPVLENKLKMTQDFPVWRITKRTILKIQKSADRKRS